MKIVYYCQNVLGIGHVHRSMELCRAFATHHDVTMITGGAPLHSQPFQFSHFQLPGLMMDSNFANLAPHDPGRELEEVKNQRRELLLDFFLQNKPDVFLVELYPFGRKAFRFELDPVLEGIRNGDLPSCQVYCSLRDILVERSDQQKFEQRIITSINDHFDGLLIHGDEGFIPLQATFSRMDDISIPFAYTGYVTSETSRKTRIDVRYELGISADTRLLVASIGGGNVGSELLFKVVAAFDLLDDKRYAMKIFSGPYASIDDIKRLKNLEGDAISVEKFSPHFKDWLMAADLSVSMAGYNTTMDILSTGVPALVYPFNQNQEQALRIEHLEKLVPIKKLNINDLKAEKLAALIKEQQLRRRFDSPISLNGSSNTLQMIEKWWGQ